MVKKSCIDEHTECVLFAGMLKASPKVLRYTKVPMEIRTPSYNQVRKHKAEGMNKGLFDYEIVVRTKKGERKLLKIEMKRKYGGVVSKEQKMLLGLYNDAGIYAIVAKGAIEAFKYVNDVINGEIS